MNDLRGVKQHFTKPIVLELIFGLLLFVGSYVLKYCPSHHMVIPTEKNNPNVLYPLQPSTFPYFLCCIVSWGIPLCFIYYFGKKRDSQKYIVTVIITFLFALSLTRFLTDSLKIFAGRPRPNFYAMTENNNQIDAYKSFPSGHSSTTFNGMMFLTLLLCGEYKIFNGEGSILKLFGCCLPLLFGCVVSISRTRDYYHNFDDIVAGSILGCVVAYLCYAAKFKALWSKETGEIESEEYVDFEENNYMV